MEDNVRQDDASETPDGFHVVGIGASAGGLESLERFFSHVPANTRMAFVVLQHLSPDFKSLMDELLARRTSMPVRHAEHGTLLEPDSVYLLPPMKEMTVSGRRLCLSDKDPRHGLALPIDTFFRSLAREIGDRAIAVVLSGSGSDGSRGILEVSKAGGLVFCESAETAKFNGMPLSAIRTGVVDRVLSPEEIADAIGSIGRGAPVLRPASGDRAEADAGVDAILRLLRDEYSIDFSHYKASTVIRRIERRLALNRSLDIDNYIEHLRDDRHELNSLYEDLLIGVTSFFRDEEAFATLEQRVIPDIIERSNTDDPNEQIRVWVPGCATGQEAYSLAIMFHEQLTAHRRPVNLKILATDVHKASLELASAGVFTAQQLAGISQERLDRFFTLKPNGYHISQALRECIVFAPHNVIRDAPFTKLDLITCRNMLIYLQPHAQKTVLTLFHFALRPGGYLFMGASESPGGLVDEFDTIDEHAKIYRKRRDIGLPRDLKLPLPRTAIAHQLSGASARTGVHPQLLTTYDTLLARYMPPGFLVDDRGVLVDSYGGVESLLKVKPRRPSQLLLDMVDEELRALISGAMSRVRRDLEPVRFVGVALNGLGDNVAIGAEPLCDPHGTLTHVLITIEKGAPDTLYAAEGARVPTSVVADRGAAAATIDMAGASRAHMQTLQDELSYTKENLQAAIQELETTNEELQATNEELIASNEELQSTNEELHSVNEELYTVNAEYQKKNAELQELNDDMEHLLNGTDVATMFLDHSLCIRKFTPRIADIFHVIPHDVGRPLRSFSHDLAYPELLADIERVLDEGVTIEAQTWDRRSRCYFLRILPYRARPRERSDLVGHTTEQLERSVTPDGVVLTLTDISALEQARARLAQLSAIVESSDDAITSETLDGVITSWNNGATRHFGYTAEEAVGRHSAFLCPPERETEIEDILAQVRNGRPVERLETQRVRKDGTIIHVSVTYSPILDTSNTIVGVSSISRDITQLVAARHDIAEREARIRLLLDSTAEAIYGIDLSGACIFCNTACARALGFDSPAALIGRQMHPLIHHTRPDGSPYPAEQSPIFEAMRHREPAHVDTEVLWRADGTSFPAEYWSHPIVRDDEVIGAVVTFLDITERRKAEAELQEGVRRREQFLAMLSHELRNPLAAILSATHLMSSQSVHPEVGHRATRIVERQARHMSRLLDDLLDVSRITHGRIVLRKQNVDLRETARSAIESLEPLMAEHQTNLIVDITDEPVAVVGDPARLQQIQANLLSNASKYSPKGAEVRFELKRVNGEAMIRVADCGRGIEPEMLPRIFDLFVQGDRSLARSDGGLGIGLTLLRSLVRLHDGRVEAHSDGPGRGSVFTVWLPIATSERADIAERRPTRAEPVRTVVVVEDQDDSRQMMKILLETKGITVHVAADGHEGANLIARIQPEIALVDLGLPVLSGYDLARRVRASGMAPRTRLVAVSGYGQDSDIQAALEAGFDEHLTKPPDFHKLEALLLRSADAVSE